MHLFRLSAAALALSLLAGSAYTQTLPPGVKKIASVEGITEYSFPNGLRALVFPDASNPKVTVNVTYLVGSRHEGYGETGMAHLLEHLLFMQTTGGRDIKKELTGHGASWNGSTSSDRTNYFETVTSSAENLRWALSLEADRMVNSKMEKAILDTEMTVVRNEFERGENSPARVLQERVEATAYLWHNYGKSTIGSRADLENVPIDKLAAFYRKYYQPDNAVVVVAGQVTESDALAQVAATLGAIARPSRKLDATYTTEPAQDGERYVALRRVGDSQEVIMAYHTPAAAHPDSVALEILAGVMSGGGGRGGAGSGLGRLTKALVDNKKAVSARMSSQQQHDPSLAVLSAQLTKEQSLKEVREVMVQTIDGIVKEPPTKEEVDRVKTRMLRSMEMQMANSQGVALQLSEWASMGDWRLMFLNRDRVKQVTPEDVVRVAKTYFVESNRTVGEFIPTAKPERAEIGVAPDLEKLFKDYKGGEAMSQGESFDPTPTAVEARVVRTKLPGGLKLVLLPRQTRGGTVSAALDLHFGTEQSLMGKAAVAQMAGSLLMRGTKTKSRQQIADEMDRLKARVTASGGGGGGGFGGGGRRGGPVVLSDASGAAASIETTRDNLTGSLKLAVDLLREPAFAESEFDQVRAQRIAAIESGRSEPASLAALEFSRRLSPYTKGDVRYVGTIDEQIAELRKVTVEDVRKFHAEFYGAANSELVVAGQFDAAEVQKTIADLLNGWTGKPYQRLTSVYKKTETANVKIETPDKQNATFEAGIRLKLSEEDADYPALLIANQIFGSDLGSRMPNRIRNQEGLSYGVSSRLAVAVKGDAAMWTASAISAPQNTPKVEASFKDELQKTLKGGFTEAELMAAKKKYKDQRSVARSQEQGLLRTLASHEALGRTMKWDDQMDSKVQALTLEQVNSAMRRYLDPASLTIVKAGDFVKAGAYLQ